MHDTIATIGNKKWDSLYMVVQGTLMAATDLKRFGNDWIEFGWVTGLTVVGQNGGVIDGQGAASWPFNKCPVRKDCKVLPTVSILSTQFRHTYAREHRISFCGHQVY